MFGSHHVMSVVAAPSDGSAACACSKYCDMQVYSHVHTFTQPEVVVDFAVRAYASCWCLSFTPGVQHLMHLLMLLTCGLIEGYWGACCHVVYTKKSK